MLDVVIVSYRCESVLRECLASLQRHPPSIPMRMQVIDNASGDGTAEMVEREFPEVELAVNARNRGFAAATNAGIRDGDAPYALALNPDVELTPGALDRLLEVMEERREVGVSGPALVRPDGSPDHAAKRGFPTPLNSLGHFTGISRRRRAPAAMRGYSGPAPARGGPVDAVNGAFMLCRRGALDEVGLFDEGFWMYMEDLDLCYRMREAGWLTWYEPSARVLHHKAASSGPVRSPRLNYAFHYGMYRFYRKHYASSRSKLANVGIYLAIGAKLLASLAAGLLRSVRRQLP